MAAAIAALATQIALSLVPLPAPGAPGPAARSLAAVAALWGLSSLCLPLGTPERPGPHSDPFAHHGCPICQVLHQTAAVLPPTQLVVDAPAPTGPPPLPPLVEAPPPRQAFLTPQSRAPPALA
ncbi:MAG: hypothetical protein U1E53_11890 [Dongiaceae bacterium]